MNPTSTALLGEVGVVAFLHAWRELPLEQGRSHARLNPSRAQVATEVERHRAEFEALVEMFKDV